MSTLLRLFLCSVLLKTIKSYVLPIEKCRLDDSKCMVPAFQKGISIFFNGIPEIGLEKTGPIDDVDFDLSGLKFSSKNGHVKGLDKIMIDEVNWNSNKKHVHLKYHTDCSVTGNYTASGKILILAIEGNGQYKMKFKNILTDIHLTYDIVKLADGEDHMRIKNYTYKYDVKDHAEYHLTNLFNGNKQLSDAVLKLINENWKIIANEFGSSLIDKLADKILKNVNTLMAKLPLKDIAIV